MEGVASMTHNEIEVAVKNQRAFFKQGNTLSIEFRLATLKKLKAIVLENEQEILTALKQDLGKPLMESYTSEIGMIITEINNNIKHLRAWAKPKRVKSTALTFPSKAYTYAEPFGVALIVSPWNYPFQLTIVPLVGAIAAGNCCIIKPSEFSQASALCMKKMLNASFDNNYIMVIDGDVTVSKHVLEQKFDKIFFTGSPNVGKLVMEKAAKNLASVTLELGGKSPCIIDTTIDIETTAKRILWGKFMNAGQTCIAPDYLIVHKDIRDQMVNEFKKWLKIFYSDEPKNSPDYGRIINRHHFDRLKSYLNDGTIIVGGDCSEEALYIEPTIIEVTDLNIPIMTEEIFGPILPMIVYQQPEEIEKIIEHNPNPLAFYLFSTDKALTQRLLQSIPFGGGCVNEVLSHIMNHHLPFGGRGTSGMGGYHGKYSFDAFSHKKAVLKKGFSMDIAMKYPPYGDKHTMIKKYVL